MSHLQCVVPVVPQGLSDWAKRCVSFHNNRKTEEKTEILLPMFKLLNQNVCNIYRDLLGFGFHFTNIMKYVWYERSTVNIMLEYNSPLLVSPLRTKIQRVYLLFVSKKSGNQSLLGLGSVHTLRKSARTQSNLQAEKQTLTAGSEGKKTTNWVLSWTPKTTLLIVPLAGERK